MRLIPLLTLALITLPAAAQTFDPGCPLPFAAAAISRPVDEACGVEGQLPPGGKNGERRQQNLLQNNFCATGEPAATTIADFVALQHAVQAKNLSWGCAACLPADRKPFATMLPASAGAPLGEGRMVRFAGYVLEARGADAGPQQGANCASSAPEDRDLMITLGTDRESRLCDGVTAWISPHFRPDAWDALGASRGISALRGHPLRVTGPLLFDAGHGLCFKKAATRGNPPRASAWEIHPVYNIEVCRETSIERCPAGKDSVWQPLDAVVTATPTYGRSPLPALSPSGNSASSAAVVTIPPAPGAPVPAADSAALLRLEQEWTAALAAGDTPALERLLADDFAGTDGSGRRQGKAGLIAAVRAAPPTPPGAIDEADVQLISDGVAVVSGRLTQTIPLRGESIAIRSRFTDTFVKRGAVWKLATSHVSRVP